MPPKKLTNKELKELKYVSMADFCTRVKEYNDMNDKLRFATQHLLLHGTQQGEPDYSLSEATYIAQLAIVAASKIEKEKIGRNSEVFLANNPQVINPHIKNAKDDLAFEFFLKDPHEYLKGYAQKNINAINEMDIQLPAEKAAKAHFQNLIDDKLEKSDFSSDVYDHMVDNNPVAIRLRSQMMLGGKDRVDEVVKTAQPGFWSRFFDTASLASKNLLTVYDAFNNPKHAMYGDNEALKKASIEYLQYKFPNWKPGDEYPNLDDLDDTEKARATLSITSLKTIELQEDFGPYMKDQVDTVYNTLQGVTFKDVDRPPLNQDLFHDNLGNDIADKEEMGAKSFDDDENELDNSLEDEIIIHSK